MSKRKFARIGNELDVNFDDVPAPKKRTSSSSSSRKSQSSSLAGGWKQSARKTWDGQTFYFNPILGRSQTQRPTGDDVPSEHTLSDGKNGSAEVDEAEHARQIAAIVDGAADIEPLDANTLKMAVLRLNKAARKNQQLRAKHHDAPEKFMESELDLDDAIQELHNLAASSELYEDFVVLKGVESLIGLFTHENTDIVISLVHLLLELFEPDAIQEFEGTEALIDDFFEHSGIELLIESVSRFNESEDADAKAVHSVLNILENLAEIDGVYSARLCPAALPWLLQRVAEPLQGVRATDDIPMDQNTFYVSEILSILLTTGGDDAQLAFADASGVKALLRVLDSTCHSFRKQKSPTDDQLELVENICDTLVSAFLIPLNQQQYHKTKAANQILLNIVKKHKAVKSSALKVLDAALASAPPVCQKFVEDQGLKTVFACFMKKSKKGADEERVISIVASLFGNCTNVSYQRLLGKFRQHGFEKVDRLCELHVQYYEQLDDADRAEKQRRIALELDAEEPDSPQCYQRRLQHGLYTLQLIDFVIGFIATVGDSNIRQRVEQLLNQQDHDLGIVKKVMQGYANNLGDNSLDEDLSQEQSEEATSEAQKEELPLRGLINGIVGML